MGGDRAHHINAAPVAALDAEVEGLGGGAIVVLDLGADLDLLALAQLSGEDLLGAGGGVGAVGDLGGIRAAECLLGDDLQSGGLLDGPGLGAVFKAAVDDNAVARLLCLHGDGHVVHIEVEQVVGGVGSGGPGGLDEASHIGHVCIVGDGVGAGDGGPLALLGGDRAHHVNAAPVAALDAEVEGLGGGAIVVLDLGADLDLLALAQLSGEDLLGAGGGVGAVGHQQHGVAVLVHGGEGGGLLDGPGLGAVLKAAVDDELHPLGLLVGGGLGLYRCRVLSGGVRGGGHAAVVGGEGVGLAVVELVRHHDVLLAGVGAGEVHLHRGLSVFIAEHGPAVLPGHRYQHRDAAHRAVVLEEHGVPGAVGGLHDAALGHAGVVHLAVKLQAGVEDLAALPGAVQGGGAPADFLSASAGGPLNHKQVVVVPDLIGVDALGDVGHRTVDRIAVVVQAGVFNEGHLVAQGDVPILVLVDGAAPGGAAAVDHVHAVVLGGEQGHVVEVAVELRPMPGAVFHVGGGEDVGLPGGQAGKGYVILAVVVADAGGPGAVAVVALPVAQGELVAVIQNVVGVAHRLPVDQVRGLHHGAAGGEVHGGAHHVVGVIHPDDVHIRDVGIHHGIGKGLIPAVRSCHSPG